MKSVIVGTAGHIDHGKTALVKALTGIDADRLEEEKRRGITIDIGFAHLDLPGPNGENIKFGFVDVPGHERFVRNMLAGVGGIDFVLLVIAADESIKPQTREHFDICRLLSVGHGITVLTKSDLVDGDTLEVVKLEVEEFLSGSFLDRRKSAIIPASAKTGAGLDELRRALVLAALEAPAKDPTAIVRLPIDRVFSMKGFGSVVTGTLVSGTIRKDDELELFPKQQRVRVRGVQVHGEAAEQAVAGQRTALNLAGVALDDLARGMMLTAPSTFRSTSRIDVSLSLLPAARGIKNGARVHLHSYTFETIATIGLFDRTQLAPGEKAYAQLRLPEPVLLSPGDRFILRQFSPVVTIGGGEVLDAFPLIKSRKESRLQFLQKINQAEPAEVVLARVSRRGSNGLSLDQEVAETGWRAAFVNEKSSQLLREGALVDLGGRFVEAGSAQALRSDLVQTVTQFHAREPLAPGIGKENLREQLRVSAEMMGTLLSLLQQEKKIELNGEIVRLPGRGATMSDEESESKTMIEHAFVTAGLRVPSLAEVLAAVKVDRTRAQKIVTLLLREKTLVKISDGLVFHASALKDLRKRLAAEKSKSPRLDVARFKDLTGISRKYAIPLLEYLDREHVTRRVGDERVIL